MQQKKLVQNQQAQGQSNVVPFPGKVRTNIQIQLEQLERMMEAVRAGKVAGLMMVAHLEDEEDTLMAASGVYVECPGAGGEALAKLAARLHEG